MSDTLEKLKARTIRTVHLVEVGERVEVREEPCEGSLPFVIRRVSVPDVTLGALRHTLDEDERVRYSARFASAGNAALAAQMPDLELFENVLSEEDQAELDRINAMASKIATAAVLHAGMVEPTYPEVEAMIQNGPYALALYRTLIHFTGVVTDPK